MSNPVKIDGSFEQEAKAMRKAMETGELPPRTAPYYQRVKVLSKLHWDAKRQREARP